MKKALLYIHGKGGTAEEADHYRPLFPDSDVMGLEYQARTPWEAAEEFSRLFPTLRADHDCVILIANSIGAYFAMHGFRSCMDRIEKAYFISPIVDMERLILNMMEEAGVSERGLRERGVIETDFGETLSWEYLAWVREHPVSWRVPARILYGSRDALQSVDTIRTFADAAGADVTVLEGGEHWFHTEEQMAFLDKWLVERMDGGGTDED